MTPLYEKLKADDVQHDQNVFSFHLGGQCNKLTDFLAFTLVIGPLSLACFLSQHTGSALAGLPPPRIRFYSTPHPIQLMATRGILKVSSEITALFFKGTVSLEIVCVVSVSEHMGWVRNVVLMSVYFGSGKPQGVGISGRGPDGQVREIQGSVYEQPKEEVDGSCHSKEGSK